MRLGRKEKRNSNRCQEEEHEATIVHLLHRGPAFDLAVALVVLGEVGEVVVEWIAKVAFVIDVVRSLSSDGSYHALSTTVLTLKLCNILLRLITRIVCQVHVLIWLGKRVLLFLDVCFVVQIRVREIKLFSSIVITITLRRIITK